MIKKITTMYFQTFRKFKFQIYESKPKKKRVNAKNAGKNPNKELKTHFSKVTRKKNIKRFQKENPNCLHKYVKC